MRVKPAPGLVVRDPVTKRPLPEQGKEVRPSSFWLRRLADGDVLELPAETPPKVKKTAPPSAPTQDKE